MSCYGRCKLSIGIVSAALLVCGCHGPAGRKGVQLDNRAGIYDTAQIKYQIDSSRLGEPLPVARIEGQLVNYDQRSSSPTPGSARGTLTVEYPHPEKRPGMALVKLEIVSRVGSTAPTTRSSIQQISHTVEESVKSLTPWPRNDEVTEVWLLDVPKESVDRSLNALDQSGFFAQRGNPKPGVSVETKVDGRTKYRRWEPVADLDQLMIRARTEGQLESYHRPQQSFSTPQREFSSVAALRAHQVDVAQRMQATSPAALLPPATDAGPGAAPYIAARQPSASAIAGSPATANLPAGYYPPDPAGSAYVPPTYASTAPGPAAGGTFPTTTATVSAAATTPVGSPSGAYAAYPDAQWKPVQPGPAAATPQRGAGAGSATAARPSRGFSLFR